MPPRISLISPAQLSALPKTVGIVDASWHSELSFTFPSSISLLLPSSFSPSLTPLLLFYLLSQCLALPSLVLTTTSESESLELASSISTRSPALTRSVSSTCCLPLRSSLEQLVRIPSSPSTHPPTPSDLGSLLVTSPSRSFEREARRHLRYSRRLQRSSSGLHLFHLWTPKHLRLAGGSSQMEGRGIRA